MDHDTQTQFAKKECEKRGIPMPLDYEGDFANLPKLEVEPSPMTYRKIASFGEWHRLKNYGHVIRGARVRQDDGSYQARYYVKYPTNAGSPRFTK